MPYYRRRYGGYRRRYGGYRRSYGRSYRSSLFKVPPHLPFVSSLVHHTWSCERFSMGRPYMLDSVSGPSDVATFVLNNMYDPDYGTGGGTATLFSRMAANYSVYRVVAARMTLHVYCENMTDAAGTFSNIAQAESMIPHHVWLSLNDNATNSMLNGDAQLTVPRSEYVHHQQVVCPSLQYMVEPGCHARLVAWYYPRRFWKGLATKEETQGMYTGTPMWAPEKRCFAHLVWEIASADASIATNWPKWVASVHIDFWARWYDGDPTEPLGMEEDAPQPSQLTQD